VGADRGGAVGAAGGVLVEGTDAPDVLAGAVDLGVVAGPDLVAMPGAVGQSVEAACQAPGQAAGLPGAILGECFQRLPVVDAVQGDQRLGDGVLLDVEGQAGDPLDETLPASSGKAEGKGQQDGLPERPQPVSVHHAPPGTRFVGGVNRQAPSGRCSRQSAMLKARTSVLARG